MASDPSEFADLRAAVVALLKAGREHVWGNKEENGRTFFADGAFVSETYDSLVLGRDEVLARRVYRDADEVLSALAPRPETEEGWRRVLGSMRPSTGPFTPGRGKALGQIEVDGIVFEGALGGGAGWTARAEGVEVLHVATAPWPYVRFRVEVSALPEPWGPFEWHVPTPDTATWRAEGLDALRNAVAARVVARLATARLLDFSAPQPLPGGGTWHARHADRYDDAGEVGFDLTVTTAAGVEHLHHALARLGSDDPAREVPAARTRLVKWIRRRVV